jgi:choline-sulfatase
MSSYKPNILLIITDQMVPTLTGAYGHPVVRTPNLDRLVQQGVRFDSAYTPCPICAPARASLMTGRYVSRIRCYDNAAPLSCDVPTVCHYLTNAGYETVASGKLHYVGPDQLHGFRRRLTTDIYPADFEWAASRTRQDRIAANRAPHARMYATPNVGVRRWTRYLKYDERSHFRALEYLRDKADRMHGSDPFLLCVSYHHPHEPFHSNQTRSRAMYVKAWLSEN